MKRILYFLISILIILSFLGCDIFADGISSEKAEKIIIKGFKNKDQSGSYSEIWARFWLPNGYILKLVKDGHLKCYKKIGNANAIEHSYYGQCSTCPTLTAEIDHEYPTYKGFGKVKVILFKEYFTGVVKTWKDKRKGYENYSYAEYMTVTKLVYPCYSLLSDSEDGGVVDGWHTWISVSRHVAQSGIKSGKKQALHTKTFKKDSQGNWR